MLHDLCAHASGQAPTLPVAPHRLSWRMSLSCCTASVVAYHPGRKYRDRFCIFWYNINNKRSLHFRPERCVPAHYRPVSVQGQSYLKVLDDVEPSVANVIAHHLDTSTRQADTAKRGRHRGEGAGTGLRCDGN